MKIHEYQAKEILRAHGAVTPAGRVATTPEEAFEIASELDTRVVVKAQVHVGGRGKAGGIKLADDAAAARDVAQAILGRDLKGLTVEKVLVEEALDIAQEYYLGIVLDRNNRCNTVMVSAEGGVDIEELAARSPEKIAKLCIDPGMGLADFQMRQLCYDAEIDRKAILPACKFLRGLYNAYLAVDANLAEINPLVVTGEGEVVAADAKINIDDSALYRQPDVAGLEEESEADEIEIEAHRRGIQYVRLDGEVGVLGNGAGLVMATLDEVKNAGGAPADFLDIGGGARADLVLNSLDLIMMTPGVKGIFCNVFGGITRCDEVARGIVEAKHKLNISLPMVVRLTGTNEEEGRRILADAGVVAAESMQEGAAKIVELTQQP
jgi:succinyl-CoA synthetase beta subunit